MSLKSRVKSLAGERGAALVEFALVTPMFLFFLAGITDYSIYLHQSVELTEAAAAGAEHGIIPGQQKNTSVMTAIAQKVASDVSGLSATSTYFYSCTAGGAQVASTTSCSGGFDYTPIMYVQVTTSATVPALIRWTGLTNGLTMQGQATYRVPWVQ